VTLRMAMFLTEAAIGYQLVPVHCGELRIEI